MRLLESQELLAKYFLEYQVSWINAELDYHADNKQVVALAEKSVRIGWTYADAFKNVRKRIWYKNRDYLFATNCDIAWAGALASQAHATCSKGIGWLVC